MSNTKSALQAPAWSSVEVAKDSSAQRLAAAQFLADFADNLAMVTLLLWVNHLTGSALSLGTMAIVIALPQVTLGLFAGVLVDRWDRRRVMVVSDLARAALFVCLAAVEHIAALWAIYLIAMLQACAAAFFAPARTALSAKLVPPQGLLAFNSLVQTGRTITTPVGATVAGLLIGLADAYWCAFVITAITLGLSSLLVAGLKVPPAQGDQRTTSPASILRSLQQGLGVIFRTRVLSGSLLVVGISMLGLSSINVLMIPLVVNELKMPATWFGAFSASQTVGMLVGGAIIAAFPAKFAPRHLIVVSAVVLGFAIAALGAATKVPELIGILLFLGLAIVPLQIAVPTVLQTMVPGEVLGRVASALRTMISVSTLIAITFAATLAEHIGVKELFALAGLLNLLAGIFAFVIYRPQSAPTAALGAGNQ